MKKNNQLLKLKIAFLHPDLGLGGAEKFLLEISKSLKDLNFDLTIFTCFYDPTRSFFNQNQFIKNKEINQNENQNENIKNENENENNENENENIKNENENSIKILKFKILPRSFKNHFISLNSNLNNLALASYLIFKNFDFDLFFLDQSSTSIPLLKFFKNKPILFYCHFPDLLLSSNHSFSFNSKSNSQSNSQSISQSNSQSNLFKILKFIYRIPLNYLEEFTTSQANTILVNSKFTAKIFKQTFHSIKLNPKILYPPVNLKDFDHFIPSIRSSCQNWSDSNRKIILSINRFEFKKNFQLLLSAYIEFHKKLIQNQSSQQNQNQLPRLVLAGGYDKRLVDNQITLNHLINLIISFNSSNSNSKLSHIIISNHQNFQSLNLHSFDIIFLINISNQIKLDLLKSPNTILFAYTPQNEHFGIGPIEAMAASLPVLAINSGGPTETILNNQTGFLINNDLVDWLNHLEKIVFMDPKIRIKMGQLGRQRVQNIFSTNIIINQLEEILLETINNFKPIKHHHPFLISLIGLSCLILLSAYLSHHLLNLKS